MNKHFKEASYKKRKAFQMTADLQATVNSLRNVFEMKEEEIKKHHETLLRNPAMKERVRIISSFFPKRFPNVQLGAEYVDKKKLNEKQTNETKNVSPTRDDIQQNGTSSHDESVNCSFNFGDLSALHYVAPQGADDSIDLVIMSPSRLSNGCSRLSNDTPSLSNDTPRLSNGIQKSNIESNGSSFS